MGSFVTLRKGLESRYGDKVLIIRLVCRQHGTAAQNDEGTIPLQGILFRVNFVESFEANRCLVVFHRNIFKT